jgi:cytosine/uracil/thiamine/allantoin permease
VTSTGSLTFTTTVWVINRVHGYTTNGRANALPAHAASLTPVDVRLLSVTDFTDGGAATSVNVTDFTRWQTKLREGAILGD